MHLARPNCRLPLFTSACTNTKACLQKPQVLNTRGTQDRGAAHTRLPPPHKAHAAPVHLTKPLSS